MNYVRIAVIVAAALLGAAQGVTIGLLNNARADAGRSLELARRTVDVWQEAEERAKIWKATALLLGAAVDHYKEECP